jgi:hypothetical protein
MTRSLAAAPELEPVHFLTECRILRGAPARAEGPSRDR